MKSKITAVVAGFAVVTGAVPAFAAEADTSETVVEQQSAEKDNKSDLQISTGSVKHILVSGNTTIPSEDIMKYITHITVGDEYNQEMVMQDVQDINNTGMVQNVHAKTLTNNGELYLVFEIKELADVESISFEGNTILSAEQLGNVVSTKKGEQFSRETIKDDMERIRSAYAQLGYVAVVNGVNNNDGAVTFSICEAKVGNIIYEGNSKTKSWVIDKIIEPYIQKDAYLRNDNLQAAYNALMNSGYFGRVKIDVQEMSERQAAIIIKLNETSTGAWNIGGAYSDTYGVELVGGIYDKNLGGTAKSLTFDFGFGTERDHYSLTFTDPYWKKSNTSFYAKAFKTDKDLDNDYYEYKETHTGGEIGFTKPVSHDGRTAMYANLRTDNVEVSDQKRGPSMNSIQENSVTMGVIHDSRNHSTGSGTLLEGAVTSSMKMLGSDEGFTKFLLSAKSYKKLSNRDLLAGRAVLNYSPDRLPGVEQFTIGGSTTVRGLEEDAQRGDKSVLGTVELRHDFNDELQGVVFADVGKAWSDEINNGIKAATGLGLRIKTAIGILRLDAAKADGKNVKFLFGIGQNF